MEDFELDFEEFEEDDDEAMRDLDLFIESLGLRDLESSSTFTLNRLKLDQMDFAREMLRRIFRETGTKVKKMECRQHELEPTAGVIRVEGEMFKIMNIEWFCRAAEFADNTEVYALANGNVKMALMFYGLLEPID